MEPLLVNSLAVLRFLPIAFLLITGLATAPSAQAAVCTAEGIQHLTETSSGPFHIVVGALPPNPTVGSVRLVVRVCEQTTGLPVHDARVQMVPTDPQGRVGAPIYALGRYTGPEEYSADLSVKEPGAWRYRIEVRSEKGLSVVEVPLEIRRPPTSEGTTAIIFAVITGIILLGGALVFARAR